MPFLQLLILSCGAVPAIAYFAPGHVPPLRQSLDATAVAPPRQPLEAAAVDPPQFPALNINKAFGLENEYQLNLGKAIDTLRRDYPEMLRREPDFSIYTEAISLAASDGKNTLEGLARYTQVFDALRFIRNTTMVHDEVGMRLVVSDGTIRVRWHAKLTMNALFTALPTLSRDESGRPVVFVDGVSVYDVNTTGYVYQHVFEDVVVTPPELQGAVDLALFAWPGGLSPPMPVPATTYRARTQRTPSPVATAARETPMERAAREREEDAARAQRLRELRAQGEGRGEKAQGDGLFARLAPSPCETNFDCERPLVCCDLIVTSVCCSSGMMVGAPRDPQLEGQVIPIPVEVERQRGPGTNPLGM